VPERSGQYIKNLNQAGEKFRIRAEEKIKYPGWRKILIPHSRRDEASIS
jgi:hypothetical protein